MIVIQTSKCETVSNFTIERGGTGIWVYHHNGYFSATDDDWREIIRQVSALLPEPAKAEAAPEDTPDPRGYVFVDQDGDAWGFDNTELGRAPELCACRPFKTREEAEQSGATCWHGLREVREWRPSDRVPPMPEDKP